MKTTTKIQKIKSKICTICNKEFKTKSGRALYCSDSCKYKAVYKMQTKKAIARKCKCCGKDYFSKHETQKLCGKECQRIMSTTIKEKPCSNCKALTRKSYSKNRDGSLSKNVFCDRECYLHYHKQELIILKCSGCNTDIARNINQKIFKTIWCSDKCKSKRDNVLTCKVCKADFCSFEYRKSNNIKGFTIVRPIKKVCSQKCHYEFYRTDEARKEKISKATSGSNHPNYVNGASYNQRIRKTDIKENFGARDKKEVFERFDNKCFNCSGTDRLSIDHNVPYSRGGMLTKSNTVLLCLSCNSSKNAKLPTDFYTEKQIKELKKLGVDSYSLFNY